MSSTETLETNPNTAQDGALETVSNETPLDASGAGHDHEGHDHEAHDDHDHSGHSHGPTLNPDCTRSVEVTVPAAEVSRTFSTVLKRYRKQARIPGFRAGKVPETLVRSRFADAIRQDVLESLLPDSFRAEIAKENIQPISQPQVLSLNLKDGEPLTFKAAFEVLPAIDVSGYEQVRVARPATELSDAEFDAELDRVRDSRAVLEPVTEDRAIETGDSAQISFTGSVGVGETTEEGAAAFEPITGEDVMIEVGGKNTLEAFNAALVGAKPGQQLQFEVSYPGDFGERRLAGKTVSYDIEVKAIKRKIQPELNDAFAKELGEYESIEDFKTQMREHLAGEKKRHLESESRNLLIEGLVSRFEFPVPETLVQQQIDLRLDRGLRALAAQGMQAEDMRKLDFDRLRAAQRESATQEVKGSLILDRIAEVEDVKVEDSDVDRELEIISLQTREPVESLRKRLTEEGGLSRIREQLRREKTSSLIFEKQAS